MQSIPASQEHSTVSSFRMPNAAPVAHDETLGLCAVLTRPRQPLRAASIDWPKFHVERGWPFAPKPLSPRATPTPSSVELAAVWRAASCTRQELDPPHHGRPVPPSRTTNSLRETGERRASRHEVRWCETWTHRG